MDCMLPAKVIGGFLLAIFCGIGCVQSAGSSQREIIGGHLRSWQVHLPPGYISGHSVPLVIAFHGHGSTPAGMARLTKLNRIADRDGFIVVYPAGLNRAWAADVNTVDDQTGVDDVAFTVALLARLEKQYSIDTRHVVLTGFSNGAHLVQLLGCRLAGRITAIVPVSGTLASQAVAGCHPTHSLTVIAFHGTDDPIDPYGGGTINIHDGGNVLSAEANIEYWAKWNQCRSPRTIKPETASQIGTYLVTRAFPDCKDNVRVILYEIAGGGHTWPGGPQYLPATIIGPATNVANASEIIGEVAMGEPLSGDIETIK